MRSAQTIQLGRLKLGSLINKENFLLDYMAQDIYERLKCLRESAENNSLTEEQIETYRATIEEYPAYIRKEWQEHFCLFTIAEVPPKSEGSESKAGTASSEGHTNKQANFICLDLIRFFKRFALMIKNCAKRCFGCCEEDVESNSEPYGYLSKTFELESPLERFPKKLLLEPSTTSNSPMSSLSSDDYGHHIEDEIKLPPPEPQKRSNGKKLLERIKAKPLKIPNTNRKIAFYCPTCQPRKWF